MPLVDSDLGKALLFPRLVFKNGRYAVGWTVRAIGKEKPPVDWIHWDPTDPDKLLRLYAWQRYGDADGAQLPYEAVDFVLDTHTGKTATLPTSLPNWLGKKDGWEMTAHWYSGTDRRNYALIESSQEDLEVGNFWLVTLDETQMQVKDLTTTMRKAVNGLLRERRPEVTADDFLVYYPQKAGEQTTDIREIVEAPFVADPSSSDQKEFRLKGVVQIRLSDGEILNASSKQKRLRPFEANEALKKADDTLNTIFQAALKSMPSKDAQALQQEERHWIAQRDADAVQAVNIMADDTTQQEAEAARENSLLVSTESASKN